MLAIWRSTVGKKVAMAATGLVLFGFVAAHMLGNLKIYQGPEKYNRYAEFLRTVGEPALPHGTLLWIARIVLIGVVAVHVISAVSLWISSRAARPIPYAYKENLAAGYAAFTSRWTGLTIALFVVFHLLHFTLGKVGYGDPPFRPGDVYANVVAGFSVWYISAFYIAAMAALAVHLYHGIWSLFQTLGWNGARANRAFKCLSVLSAAVIFCGNTSIPVAALLGILK